MREEKAVPLRHGTTFSVGGEQEVRESVCVCARERERESRDYEKVESVGDQKA